MRVMPLTIYDLEPLQWYFGHSQLHIGDTVKYQFNVREEAGSVTCESIPGSSAPEERRFFCAEDSTAH